MRNAVAGAALSGGVRSAMAQPVAIGASATRSSAPAVAAANTAAPIVPAGYAFLRPAEADFVEALVDHMVPADELTGSGTALGLNQYFDRTLGGAWGDGAGLYLEGPWHAGTPAQGYQLPLTPAELFRVGTDALRSYCSGHFGKPFASLDAQQKETLLHALNDGQVVLEGCPDTKRYFALLHQLVNEGLFADPLYGGNVGKAGWRLVGFPGVIAEHEKDVRIYRNSPYSAPVLSIGDAS